MRRAALIVEVRRARHAGGEVAKLAFVALPELADRVAVLAVPLRPARREPADLVAAHADVPRLGDQLDRGEHRVLGHGVEEARTLGVFAADPGERGRQIETEAVDPHLVDPVAERIHDHAQDMTVAQLERVAAAREVVVVPLLAFHEVVVRAVVDAAERERRAELAAFGGVVVDHIEDDLDAGVVHDLREGLDLAQAAAADILRMRRKEADRVVAPIVLEPALDQMAVVHEGMDRHELDRGDAEVAQVLDHGGSRESAERAACRLVHLRVPHREAAHVHLVDDALVRRPRRRPLGAPGEGGVDHHRLGEIAGAVTIVERQIGVRIAEPVGKEGVVPLERSTQQLGVGVEQQLVGIEAMPGIRLVGPVHAIAVVLARPQVGKIAVPDLVRHLRQRDPIGLLAVVVEQAQLDLLGMRREEGEVHAGAIPAGAERIRQPRPKANV